MTDNKFPEAEMPCHVCDGEGVVGSHIFSADVAVCPHCEGTGEEPLRRRVRRKVAKADDTLS